MTGTVRHEQIRDVHAGWLDADQMGRALELLRAKLGPGDVELYVEAHPLSPRLTITMCQALP